MRPGQGTAPGTEPVERVLEPLSVAGACSAMEATEDRDAVLVALLRGAASFLEDLQLYRVQPHGLRGLLALHDGLLDRDAVRRLVVASDAEPVSRCLRSLERQSIALRPGDLGGVTFDHGLWLWVEPLVLEGRPICVLFGLAAAPPGPTAERGMRRLALAAADRLGRLVLEARAREGSEPAGLRTPPPETEPAEEVVLLTCRRGDAAISRVATPARPPVRVHVDLESESNFYAGFDRPTGVFVATFDLPCLGESVTLWLTLPTLDGACVIRCTVDWIRDTAPDPDGVAPGAGLRFAELEGELRQAIDRFVEQREPIFFA
jgi:Tfp pilus assembly protein PilZ